MINNKRNSILTHCNGHGISGVLNPRVREDDGKRVGDV